MRKLKYVVATDLSAASRAALTAAAALARHTGAAVEVLCVVPTALAARDPEMVGRVGSAARALVRRAAGPDAAVEPRVVVARDVPAAIRAHAERVDADLVAVGPSGATGWRKRALGSVTERMMRLAPAMLLVVRGRLPDPPPRILAAIDMSPGSMRAFRAALDLARATGAKLTALHVVAPPGTVLLGAGDVYLPDLWTFEAERVAEAQRHFGAWVGRFPAKDLDVEARVVEGPAVETIVREAKAAEAALVVVGSHGKSAVHEFFVGSVAHGVTTHAPMSVLVVRARPGFRHRKPARRPAKA